MKSIKSFLVFLILSQILFGSDYIDVVYLKNGDVAKGIIIENVPNDYVKLEIQGGTLWEPTLLTFKYSNIEKFAKENISTLKEQTNYTNKLSSLFANSKLLKSGFNKGVKIGINMGRFIGDDSDLGESIDPKFNLRFALGGFLTYSINDQLSIRPELLYSMKGSKYKESEEGETYKVVFKMNYLDIPVLGVYSVQENINVFAGPYLGLYLNGTTKYEYHGETDEDVIEKEDIANLDFGLVFGGSYGLGNNLAIEARYTLGLKTFDKKPDDWDDDYDDYKVDDIKHSALQLMVSYSF